MADTLTTNIRLTNQTEGGNNNSWGVIADTNFETLDDKFGDTTSISTTGGDTTLTTTQEIVAHIHVTGTLVSNANLIFSGRGGFWVVYNGTSGSFTLTCKLSGSSGVVVTQGNRTLIYCDGSDINQLSEGGLESNTIALFGQTAAPTGWTKLTDHNDKALRVVSGTVGSGGTSAFTTVFGKTATDSHVLTTAEMPGHTHAGTTSSDGSHSHSYTFRVQIDNVQQGGGSNATEVWRGEQSANTGSEGSHNHTFTTGSTGSGSGHTHNMDIRVQYVDVIRAQKD